MTNKTTSRRKLLKQLAAGTLATAIIPPFQASATDTMDEQKLKGNINHSVCQWTYGFMPLDELCAEAKKMGVKAIDLIGSKDWPTLQKDGVECSMCYIGGRVSLNEGWNNPKFHDSGIK